MSGIGDLVTHLVADTSGFSQGFARGQSIAKTGIAGITSAIAPLTGALAAAFGAGSAISAAKEDLRAMQKLEAVLKATGGAAGMSADEVAALATELQGVTNFGDETTVGAAAVLASFGNIRGDNFKTAIALAQDMATVLDTDLDTAAKKLGKSLKDVAPEQIGEKLAELQNRFGGAAQAVADPWTQLTNVIGDIGEQIGGILLPWVDMLSTGLMGVATTGVDTFSSLKQTSQEWADSVAIIYGTLGDQAYLWYLQTELAVVQAAAAFGHFFTQEIPAFFQWFGQNWRDIFFTAGDYALTVLINLGENIRNVWQSLLDFISGKPVNFDWKPLTEGAVNTIKAMPDIPARVAGEFENGLKEDIKAQEDFLRQSQEKLAEDIIANRAEKEAAKTFIPEEKDMGTGEGKKSSASSTSTDTRFGALQKGSADALSAVFKAMRGGDDVPKKQLEEQQETNVKLDELNSSIEDMSSTTNIGQWVLPA